MQRVMSGNNKSQESSEDERLHFYSRIIVHKFLDNPAIIKEGAVLNTGRNDNSAKMTKASRMRIPAHRSKVKGIELKILLTKSMTHMFTPEKQLGQWTKQASIYEENIKQSNIKVNEYTKKILLLENKNLTEEQQNEKSLLIKQLDNEKYNLEIFESNLRILQIKISDNNPSIHGPGSYNEYAFTCLKILAGEHSSYKNDDANKLYNLICNLTSKNIKANSPVKTTLVQSLEQSHSSNATTMSTTGNWRKNSIETNLGSKNNREPANHSKFGDSKQPTKTHYNDRTSSKFDDSWNTVTSRRSRSKFGDSEETRQLTNKYMLENSSQSNAYVPPGKKGVVEIKKEQTFEEMFPSLEAPKSEVHLPKLIGVWEKGVSDAVKAPIELKKEINSDDSDGYNEDSKYRTQPIVLKKNIPDNYEEDDEEYTETNDYYGQQDDDYDEDEF